MDGYFHLSLDIPSPGISGNLIWELHHPSQLYNLNGCGVAPFAITTDGSKLQLRLETGDCKVGQNWTYRETVGIPSLSPYPKDTWIDVIVHIRFSEANDGLVELWSRTAGSSWPDSPEISRSGIPTMPFSSSTGVHNAQLYTEMGLYPGYSGYNGNDTIYLDDYRRESSLAAAKGENEQPAAAPAPAPAPAAAPAPAVTPEPTTPADNAAPTRQYMIEWGGRLFSTAGSFRSYLLGLGVDWPEFLKRHPAAVEQTGLISVQWDGEHFYDQASLVSQLDKQGISYRSWAEDHPRAASVLAGRPVASAQRAPRVLQTKVAITWSGVAFTTADGLRTLSRAPAHRLERLPRGSPRRGETAGRGLGAMGRKGLLFAESALAVARDAPQHVRALGHHAPGPGRQAGAVARSRPELFRGDLRPGLPTDSALPMVAPPRRVRTAVSQPARGFEHAATVVTPHPRPRRPNSTGDTGSLSLS